MSKKITPSINPTLPKSTIKVGNVEYALMFDFAALCLAEKATGLNLLRSLDFGSMNANALRGLVYAALLKAQPEIKLEDVDAMLSSPITAFKFVSALADAWTESNPEPEAETEPKND